jgi:hypothetical protein
MANTTGIIRVSRRIAAVAGVRDLNQIGLRSHQLFRKRGHTIQIASSPTNSNLHVGVPLPPKRLHRLQEFLHPSLSFGIALRYTHKHSDPPHSLLRAHRHRQRSCCAADKHDELASPHLPLRAGPRFAR